MPTEQQAFKFCTVCGKLYSKSEGFAKSCDACGYVYFISAKPSTGVIVTNSKKGVLLIKRKFEPKKGTYTFSAGFADGPERIEDAAVREVKEEVGIDISDLEKKFLGTYPGEYEYKGVTKYFQGAYFAVEINDDLASKIIVSEDATEFMWIDPGKLDLSIIGFESNRQALRDYFEF
jgi:ADP-ribose pyrophosphatase YjhB (NUDIX family)